MKKFCKIFASILAMALLVFTPGVPTVTGQIANVVATSTNSYTHAVPAQSANIFTSDAKTYDLSSWTKPSGSYLVSQQVTSDGNAAFHETYPDNTLSNAELVGRSPYAIITTDKMPAYGAYTTSAITLSANSYYFISVDYYIVEQKNNTTEDYAFGTFSLDGHKIDLRTTGKWETATFYIQTDKLATATVTPMLYFGANEQNALGGIYFDNFTVCVVSHDKFTEELAASNSNNAEYLNFTHSNEFTLVKEFDNTEFTASVASTNTDADNSISTASLPYNLGFYEEQNYFYHKDGTAKDVMFMKAVNANASLTLEDYSLITNPHEIYMFQFYSIATSAADFTGFHLMIGDVAQEISNLTDYPNYNGWQLNTVFFIAGQEINQELEIKFSLSTNEETTTGWACLDEFKIYKVNGSYASNNASGLGVHGTRDQNSESENTSVTNGGFNIGRASDTVQDLNSSYPYPLNTDDSWTTNNKKNNGIVNLRLYNRFNQNHPGYIDDNQNNNVYMMYNDTAALNTVTSPVITTTVGTTTYVSFDAHSTAETLTTAYLFTAETDDNGEFINKVEFDSIQINDNEWHHYEFAIIEDSFASARNYYLCFAMNGEGYTFIDNVTTTDATTTDQSTTVDLTNTLGIDKAWVAADGVTKFYKNATANGLTLENIDKKKTVVQNSFAYNLTTGEDDSFYQINIQARGENAYLGLSGYEGLLEVTTDKINPEQTYEYKLFLQPTDTTTTTNLQITLGYVTTDAEDSETAQIAAGNIFIENIKITSITEDEFNLNKNSASAESRTLVLATNDETQPEEEVEDEDSTSNNFFGENWWYLVPSLITALALLLGIIAFLLRKIKFDKHITKKTTSYARDMRLKNQQNKIVAQKAVKVDNVTNEQQDK